MQLDSLDQISDRYAHIYLSPHLDDAALSCGGAILQQRAAGEPVLVITLCTAAPDPDSAFSALALDFHRAWRLSPAEVVAARLREDALAMERLGTDFVWAGMLDAIYRFPSAYDRRETLFGTPASDDPLLPALRQTVANLRQRAPSARLYAPLGVGSHVDHQITHRAAREQAAAALALYEDLPYALKPNAVTHRLAAIDARLQPETLPIEATLAGKIESIAAYASQLDELFGSATAMAEAISAYARAVGPQGSAAERRWKEHDQ